jgi:phage terminase large subunit-like protein
MRRTPGKTVRSLMVPEKYIRDVVERKIIVSEMVRLQCVLHIDALAHAAERGLKFDRKKAQAPIDFIQRFTRHSQGEWAGHLFELQPWQQALIWILYGWRHAATGFRRYRYAYVELAKGNGKSCLASALGLYEMVGAGEPGAEVYSVATKKDQARIVFSEAERMVHQSPALSRLIKNFRDNLHVPSTACKFQPLSSDEDSLDGPRPQCLIADELHAWSGNGRKLWDVLVNALGKRRSPLFLAITTAGSDRQSICWQQHEYSEKVLRRIVADDTWFSWICTLDADDDWENESTWVKANPNLGTTIRVEELRAMVNKARNDPASLNGVLRLRLGKWTRTHTIWMPMEKWDACPAVLDLDDLKRRPCIGALDLSTTTDISCYLQLFPPTRDGHWAVLPHFFLPEDNIAQRAQRDRVPYDVWSRGGLFELTPGNVIDYSFIRYRILEERKVFPYQKEIVFDRWNAQQIVSELSADGFEMIEWGQGFASMSAPTKRLMELVLGQQLNHGGNPILRWMASNVVVRMDPAGNIKPDKEKSSEKIDGIVALVMALGRASLQAPKAKSIATPFYI